MKFLNFVSGTAALVAGVAMAAPTGIVPEVASDSTTGIVNAKPPGGAVVSDAAAAIITASKMQDHLNKGGSALRNRDRLGGPSPRAQNTRPVKCPSCGTGNVPTAGEKFFFPPPDKGNGGHGSSAHPR